MRINSKKDNEGRIKHHMSKIFDRNLSEEIMNNVQLINALYISWLFMVICFALGFFFEGILDGKVCFILEKRIFDKIDKI